MTTAKQIAHRAAQALDAKKGQDIKLLRVTDVTTLADYFLICTGTSMTEAGETLLHREGHRSGTWVLLDFGSLVVHVFTDDTRKFYDLERLWSDAVEVPLTCDE